MPETETPRETVARIIQSCVYGQLATVSAEGTAPRVRPVCAFLQEDFTILVPSHRQTGKISEIENNPAVEICFCDAEHWQVRVAGRAELETRTAEKQRLVDTTLSPKLWHGFFPGGGDDESYVLYRIHPERIRWMKEWELRYRELEI